MASRLTPCPSCARHVRASERTCPFCAGDVPETAAPERPALRRPASRVALLFAGAAVVGACGGSTVGSSGTSGESSTSGGTSGTSGSTSGTSGTSSGTTGGPVAMYGPAPVPDSGADANEGGPVAMYGPAPVDGGNG